MATGPGILIDHLRRTVAPPLAALPDDALLRRSARGGIEGEAAFGVLLRRHGPLVLRACRAALRNAHDADDCFQAVFLVLLRQAGTLRLRGPLGPWLFQVARRVCARCRADAARRQAHEFKAAVAESVWQSRPEPDVAALVHEEVGRLPERLRAAVVLCDLAGLSYQEAGLRLGVTHTTIRGRLARARERLRRRLAHRGLGPDTLAVVPLAVPAALARATSRAAALVTAGSAEGFVSESVLVLVNGGLKTMLLTKLKVFGLSLLTAGILLAGAVGLTAQDRQGAKTAAADEPAQPKGAHEDDVTLHLAPDAGDPAEAIARLARETKQHDEAGNLGEAQNTLAKMQEVAKQWQDKLSKERAKRVAAAALDAKDIALELDRALTRTARPEPGLEERVKALEQKLDLILKRLDTSPYQPRNRTTPSDARPK